MIAMKILQDDKFRKLGVSNHYPLKKIVRNFKLLNEQEIKYVMNSSTHVDFLVADQLSHKPILVIEVDGTSFHKEGTKQADRDER